MATEYGLELLNKVQKDFAKLYANDSKIKALTKKIANKSTSYVDANDYAIRTGELLSKALTKHINSNELNYISKELAEDILRPALTTDYELISNAVLAVQKNQNTASGIGLEPQVADLDKSRIDGLINKISSYDTLDQGEWLLKEPIVNYSQSVVDNTAKKNMETYSKAGMAPKIIRKAEAGACKWCKALAGTYDYADVKATGSDVYRRHGNCRCQVTFENGKKRQDVWSKPKWEVEEEQAKKERIKKIITKDQIEEKIRNVKNTADFYVGLNGHTLLGEYADWIGTNKMRDYLNSLESQTAKRIIITDYRKTSFIGDGGTVDIRKFEKTTGINCGRNGNNHKQKINDLISQTKKALLKDLPKNDRLFLENYLKRLMEVKD